jgi:hypothetical protein
MRTLDDIQAELAATAQHLADLQEERDWLRTERHLGIVADFDAGLDRAAIAGKWEVSYGRVANILHRAGRSERSRLALGLSPKQRRHYRVALRGGVPPILARRIAEAVGT